MIVRYADDIVVGFAHEVDARRVWDAMRKRFEQFALSLHPEKTRLIFSLVRGEVFPHDPPTSSAVQVAGLLRRRCSAGGLSDAG